MTITAKLLKAAQSEVNESPAFRKLGNVDTKLVVKSGKSTFLVTFRAFQCDSVAKIYTMDARDGDVTIEMSPSEWRTYLESRKTGEGKTIAQLDVEKPVVQAANPRKKLDFYRYHLSLQQFLDAGAEAV